MFLFGTPTPHRAPAQGTPGRITGARSSASPPVPRDDAKLVIIGLQISRGSGGRAPSSCQRSAAELSFASKGMLYVPGCYDWMWQIGFARVISPLLQSKDCHALLIHYPARMFTRSSSRLVSAGSISNPKHSSSIRCYCNRIVDPRGARRGMRCLRHNLVFGRTESGFDHEAVIGFCDRAPRRRAHSCARRIGQGQARVAATSDRSRDRSRRMRSGHRSSNAGLLSS
jgi:hypothetical protein